MSEIIKGCLGFKGEKGEHGEVGTPIPFEGTFQELQNSEENRDRFYIIMDEQDEVYYKHWVYYDEKTEQWKDGGEYLANLVINLEDLTQEEWESLKSNLTNYYKRYESVYTTTQENEINIPINISQYNTLAILEVYIEGRMLNRNEYAINGTNSITLNIPLSEIGTKVHFIVYRSVCASNEDLNELKGPKGDSGAIVFDTVADMKEADLQAGDTCQTLGYYSANDGGAGLYKIVDDSQLVDDGGSIHSLTNGLKAQLIINSDINLKQLGARTDTTFDNSPILSNAFKIANKTKKSIYIPRGNYSVYTDIETQLNSGISIYGDTSGSGFNENKSTIMDYRTTENYLIEPVKNGVLGFTVQNINFTSTNRENGNKCINLNNTDDYLTTIQNCGFFRYHIAIRLYKVNAINIENCAILFCGGIEANSNVYAIEIDQCMDVHIDDSLIEHCRFIIKNQHTGSLQVSNSHIEMSNTYLVEGLYPIWLENYFGSSFVNCNLVGLSIKTWKEEAKYQSYDSVPFFIYSSSGYISITGCNVDCGAGSGAGTTNFNNQLKFLYGQHVILTSNRLNLLSYLVPSIKAFGIPFIDNNHFRIRLDAEDYSSYGKRMLIIDMYNNVPQLKNSIFFDYDTSTEPPILPWLTQQYQKQIMINSTGGRFKMSPVLNEFPNSKRYVTYVIEEIVNFYGHFNLEIFAPNSGNINFKGIINVAVSGNMNIASTDFKAIGPQNKILITNDTENKRLYIQVDAIGNKISNLTFNISGIDGMECQTYIDGSIQEDLSGEHQLTIN